MTEKRKVWQANHGLHVFMLTGLLGVFCWLVAIPLAWSVAVRGKTGVTASGGRMQIDYVVPWPNYRLWCYAGSWIQDDVTHTLQDGTVISHASVDLPGYCYVTDLNLEKTND